MNILLFTTIYPGAEAFGIPSDTKTVHYFAKEWKKQGHHVEVIYLYQNAIKKIRPQNLKEIFYSAENVYVYEGISVHLFRYQLLVPHAIELQTFQMRDFQIKVEACIEKIGFDADLTVVHFPMSFIGFDYHRISNRAKFATLHNCDLQGLGKFSIDTSQKYMEQFNYFGCRNKQIRKEFYRKFGINSELIYSGISSGLLAEPAFIQKKASTKKEIVKIVFSGNLIPLKNVDILINAISKVKFVYDLEIVGSGSEEEKLVSLVRKLGIGEHIHFRGRVSRKESVRYIKDADIFAMVSSPETFGLVYLEAMAQGCIVVGSKNEGIDGVIKDGCNGYLVEPRDIDALVSILESIYSLDVSDKQKIIFNAYNTALSMTDGQMAESYLNIVRKGNG